MTKTPRPYQTECVNRVQLKNTIVNMPTGTGKTLIAVLAIDIFRSRGKAIFLVPTRPLVSQQATCVREDCKETIFVKELAGSTTDHLTGRDWLDIVRNNDVLVGTPEVFRKALVDNKYLNLTDFSLIIFDECHNAVGNSPMAAILRDAVHREHNGGPRVLGLTASFVNGSLKDIEKKRQDIEALMQAKIFCPDIDQRPAAFKAIMWEPDIQPKMVTIVEEKTKLLLSSVVRCGICLKDSQKAIQSAVHILEELGLSAFHYYLRECLVPQLQHMLTQSLEYSPANNQQRAADTNRKLSILKQEIVDGAERLKSDGELTKLPWVSSKAIRLMELIATLHREKNNKDKTRIIIFSERTVLANPLAYLVQEHVHQNVATVTGVGSMTDAQREKALEKFRDGRVPLMACTAALEEGLDVSACEVVIRFSNFKTTKSHTQGAGRARAKNAEVYYFCNDPQTEINKAALMESTAKADNLALSEQEMARRRKHQDVPGVHPHNTAGGEISIFNGLQLVYEFASRTMGQSFRPEETMLAYVVEKVCEQPGINRKVLNKVTVPSPDGFFEVHIHKVNQWWGETKIEDVVERDRIKNWDPHKKDIRRFLYVVAVELSKRGYLDYQNAPTARALQCTKLVCPAMVMSSGFRVNTKYAKSPQAAATGATDASTCSSTPQSSSPIANARIALTDSRSPSSGVSTHSGLSTATPTHLALTSSPSAGGGHQFSLLSSASGATSLQQSANTNFKGMLNELVGVVAYDTKVAVAGSNFVSTVTCGEKRFTGRPWLSKKSAEQSAAEEAWNSLRRGGQELRLVVSSPETVPEENFEGCLNDFTSPDVEIAIREQIVAVLRSAAMVKTLDIERQINPTCPKSIINRHLYELERQGIAKKVQMSPPMWKLICGVRRWPAH